MGCTPSVFDWIGLASGLVTIIPALIAGWRTAILFLTKASPRQFIRTGLLLVIVYGICYSVLTILFTPQQLVNIPLALRIPLTVILIIAYLGGNLLFYIGTRRQSKERVEAFREKWVGKST